MNRRMALGVVCFGWFVWSKTFTVKATEVALPAGFEDIFSSRQTEIFDFVYGNASIGSFTAVFDHETVTLDAPKNVFEQITSVDMPALVVDKNVLLKELSSPLERVAKQGFKHHNITVWINESDASLHLLLPSEYFALPGSVSEKSFISYKNQAGFVHSQNVNLLSDSYGDSFTLASNDVLNLTGNSYIKSAWSFSKDIELSVDELALYLENNSTRFKAGRQRMNDNFTYSTPSLSYSFFNPISFDGLSLGYMTDNYLNRVTGAASQVTVFLPQSGTVEIYANGKLIDLQQVPPGLQALNTDSWPMGAYDVQLVVKLPNGVRETKTQPFFKRSGMFRSGDFEYSVQLGRYDQGQASFVSDRGYDCDGCSDDPRHKRSAHRSLAGLTLGYTTQSVFSFGAGVLRDDSQLYFNSSIDIPVDSWLIERLHSDFLLGNDNSYGYQVGLNKNFNRLGVSASYRSNRYYGDESEFRRYGVVPAYDFDYLQFGATTFLPWNIGLSATYSINTQYQQYEKKGKNNYNSWDIALNRDFPLSAMMNLRVDLGYHQAVNESVFSRGENLQLSRTNDDRIFARFTIGLREHSYNHYQTLNLRGKVSDDSSDNQDITADYALDVYNPSFDRSGQYSFGASATSSKNSQRSLGGSLSVDNDMGYSSVGFNNTLGSGNYKQLYLSQRGGLAIGNGMIAWGKTDNNTALIIDATDLPDDQYFEVNNRDTQGVVVKGGGKTTLNIQPYQKIAPVAEQSYNTDTDEFYNLSTHSTSTWALPGQVYNVKLTATKNQTVTGRIFYSGRPIAHARVVGGNTVSDDEGYFIGDFTLNINSNLEGLTVIKDGVKYNCPLVKDNIKLTQGVMQIREVKCEK